MVQCGAVRWGGVMWCGVVCGHSELPRPIFQIRPRMYVRMYEIAAFCSPEEYA